MGHEYGGGSEGCVWIVVFGFRRFGWVGYVKFGCSRRRRWKRGSWVRGF